MGVRGDSGRWGATLGRVTMHIHSDGVTFEKRPEGKEVATQTSRGVSSEETRAQALKQELHVSEEERGRQWPYRTDGGDEV